MRTSSRSAARRPQLLTAALALLLLLSCTVAASMDMPADPVSGEMVMSSAYHFDLKNGQRLRFATQDSLTRFRHDPTAGLKSAETPDAATAPALPDRLCPVCGMETSVKGGPQVSALHGEQVIKTCSMTHARQVLANALLFEKDASPDATGTPAAPADPDAAVSDAFCSGPGTTMLNGFMFGRSGAPCILLWFPGWVLATRWLYALGCVAVALVAVFNEYLLQLRRVLRKESTTLKRLRSATTGGYASSTSLATTETTQLLRSSSYSSVVVPGSLPHACCPAWFRTLAPEMQHAIHCVLHGVTISIAYLLMLVSMTYDWVLFLSVIGGYVAGHYVFGERRDAVSDMGHANFP
ncbi:hypothetical protein PybrP1_001608 [[Pythium] brassicae (nom. inval.)]|nr:hypothetical protein PybrP1_001608 [[Pythium] brassicae (nom. inval.)]